MSWKQFRQTFTFCVFFKLNLLDSDFQVKKKNHSIYNDETIQWSTFITKMCNVNHFRLFEFFQEVWHNNIRHLPLIGQLTCGFLAFTCLPLLVSVVSISVCILVPMRIISKFTTKWCTCKNRMDGKTVLFTGATSGKLSSYLFFLYSLYFS